MTAPVTQEDKLFRKASVRLVSCGMFPNVRTAEAHLREIIIDSKAERLERAVALLKRMD